ncbi:murein transglycosylase [Phormidesmis priestleyi ULC007]|uniref:peptidoglycan lytic exotransglycosylase n=1 Tax=Phormidesmis priestleyi ULC007 TaxID=1920490 RepID=A0A2T1DLB8_9CYAN|nr:murein transglycosylase A [Phormidesmis priestleyi]PSB21290.1 murein transglycosylase [Phormidesmis priestleyi ULC007]PZO50661.1 MAG: murein transglycosylase [Phormidesmis priestleyi]
MRNLQIVERLRLLALISLGIAGGWVDPARSLPIPTSVTPSPIAPSPIKPTQPPSSALDEQLWHSGDRKTLLSAIDYSLRYLQTAQAVRAYQKYPVKGVTRDRVDRSLRRFKQLILASRSAQQLQTAIQREFVFYQSTGKDNQGTVSFTGYFEPVHKASRVRTADYRYPLYRSPDLARLKAPHPTRLELEGKDGLQTPKGLLRGLELVWLHDRLEAFLVQVQGSARLQLTDGTTMTIGVAAHTNQPYTGIGRELVKDGKLRLEDLNLPNVVQYFQQHPDELDLYLPRNRRFVFFQNTQGAPATGSLGVPVTAERSIATDKSLMPPGAIALIQTQLPILNVNRQLEQRLVSRFVLDQDTGGAILGAGRVDVFMGTGKEAGDRAGLVNSTGQLYYLLLK